MGVIHKKDKPDKAAELEKQMKELKEKNQLLEIQLTDTQLALVEIYESVVM